MLHTTTDETTNTTSYPNYINPDAVCNVSLDEFLVGADFPTVSIDPRSDFQPTINFDSMENNEFSLSVNDADESKETSDLFKTAIELSLKTSPTTGPAQEAKQTKAHDIAKADKSSISSYVAKACHNAAVGLTNTAFTIFSRVKNSIAISVSADITPTINPDYSALEDIEDNTSNDLASSKTSYQNASQMRR